MLNQTKNIIAVLDDETDILNLIAINLEKANFAVLKFEKPSELFNYFENNSTLPAVLVLDLMLPEIDGLDIARKIKNDEKLKNIFIIMLTAKDDLTDKLIGLEIGADDYMTKPFSVKELLVRIKVLLRRNEKNIEQVTDFDGIKIDSENLEVFVDGELVKLTKAEFKILEILISRIGKPCSRDKILYHLWQDDKAVVDRTIDVHIRHLRKKIEPYSDRIKSIHGVGYKFV